MPQTNAQMLINYVPGEECRVAVVQNGRLEEFHAERASSVSRVGNIYAGTVANVEPAIQAAFVDFGVGQHGFLHVTDVHPRYFPGEDEQTTERVGHKTPRRERPPIQKCFRRGDEVLVQVLKEGVGTKGPTLTSYLSIPGRFLVMMPQMDHVGVSRRVEDEEQRRAMRQVLDQLDLPEGFGFIVRTAGMNRTKAELKRDLAYLMRLWKDMEARLKAGPRPRLLYSESDLLVRALRDMLGPEVGEIVIDNEQALARAARFLKILAPRRGVRLLQYEGATPIFHAFGIEPQIALMHAREVPLPSGGRLVIEETEALVAIDVNSGKMRDARDAETNAYRTNCEAVDEICRQIRLRDLGGIIINDLIDMRSPAHRKDIEQRFRERLRQDRARTTILPISGFGILEMTRQRMRGSHERTHFTDCPTCRGRGVVQRPDSVAADALRNLAALLTYPQVARVEMAVGPRVASELLSSRRRMLNQIERRSGKPVEVRVSETVAVDRVVFYAYDASGADIDVESLPAPTPPQTLTLWPVSDAAADWTVEPPASESEEPSEAGGAAGEPPVHPIEMEERAESESLTPAKAGGGERRRRRRRRRGRAAREQVPGAAQAGAGGPQPPTAPSPQVREASAGSFLPTESVPDQTHRAACPLPGDEEEIVAAASDAAEMTGAIGTPTDDGGAAPDRAAAGAAWTESERGAGRRRRRRRRRRTDGAPSASPPASDTRPVPPPLRGDSWDLPPQAIAPTSAGPAGGAPAGREASRPHLDGVAEATGTEPSDPSGAGRARRRRRRRRRGQPGTTSGPASAPATDAGPGSPVAGPGATSAPVGERPLRLGGGYQKAAPASGPVGESAAGAQAPSGSAPEAATPQPSKTPPRLLYAASRRRLTPGRPRPPLREE